MIMNKKHGAFSWNFIRYYSHQRIERKTENRALGCIFKFKITLTRPLSISKVEYKIW